MKHCLQPLRRLSVAFYTLFMGFPLVAKANTIPTDSTGTILGAAVVTGTRTPTDPRHLTQTVSTISHDELAATGRLNLLPTLAEQVPSLFVTARGMLGFGVSDGAAGGISLRGMSGSSGRLLVLIDGHPQYQGIFGHPISDAYQTLLAERVEVVSGAASVLYGSNAMGGVVNIVTRRPTTDGTATDVRLSGGSYGTVQLEATNRLRHGRFSSVVATQYARSDNHRPHMGFEQYGGYAKMGYDFSEHWLAYADIDLTHFAAAYAGATDTPIYGAKQWVNRGVATAVVENHYARTTGALSVYHNFGRHKINDGYETGEEPPTTYFRSNDALTGVSWYQTAQLFTGNHLTLGADYRHIYGRAWNRDIQTGTTTADIGHIHENEVAGYADIRQDIGKLLTVDVGLRYDHHSQTGGEWVPQGGIVFRPTTDSELRGTIAKGFRRPTVRELYFWRPANADLRPERSISYELAWSHRPISTRLTYGLSVFYLKADNLITTERIDGRPMNVNTGAMENTGAELRADYRFNAHWRISGNYCYLYMNHPIAAAPKHKAWLGLHFTTRQWQAAIAGQYVHDLYTVTGSNAQRENFLLVNASAAYAPCALLKLWLRGENLLAQRYELNAGYPMPRATVMAGIDLSF